MTSELNKKLNSKDDKVLKSKPEEIKGAMFANNSKRQREKDDRKNMLTI